MRGFLKLCGYMSRDTDPDPSGSTVNFQLLDLGPDPLACLPVP